MLCLVFKSLTVIYKTGTYPSIEKIEIVAWCRIPLAEKGSTRKECQERINQRYAMEESGLHYNYNELFLYTF